MTKYAETTGQPAASDEELAEQAGLPEESVDIEEMELDNLRKELEACQARRDDHLDQLQRTTAEFVNYKKRSERDQAEFRKNSNATLLRNLLPVLDDMDRAFGELPDELKGLPWTEGMSLIHRKLHSIFDHEGVQEIETVGHRFDPAFHEAVTHEPSDTVPEGIIIGEVQKGYRLNDRVLRVAAVRVSAGKTGI